MNCNSLKQQNEKLLTTNKWLWKLLFEKEISQIVLVCKRGRRLKVITNDTHVNGDIKVKYSLASRAVKKLKACGEFGTAKALLDAIKRSIVIDLPERGKPSKSVTITGNRFKALREATGLTQMELADLVGTHYSVIIEHETKPKCRILKSTYDRYMRVFKTYTLKADQRKQNRVDRRYRVVKTNRVLAQRTIWNCSQKDLAKMIGISHTTIERLESGKEVRVWRRTYKILEKWNLI